MSSFKSNITFLVLWLSIICCLCPYKKLLCPTSNILSQGSSYKRLSVLCYVRIFKVMSILLCQHIFISLLFICSCIFGRTLLSKCKQINFVTCTNHCKEYLIKYNKINLSIYTTLGCRT